jgi:hypothetical protein
MLREGAPKLISGRHLIMRRWKLEFNVREKRG